MSFIKYPSLENHYNQKYIKKFKNDDLNTCGFVIQEKIDGANICHRIKPNGEIFWASRNRVLGTEENFFQLQEIIQRKKYKIFTDFLIQKANEINQEIHIYGEIFGPSVYKRVNYGPENHILFFELRIGDNIVPQKDFYNFINLFFKESGEIISPPPLLITDSFEEAFNYDSRFSSKIYELFGYEPPNINGKENICEGIVIKPFKKLIYSIHKETFYLKKKNQEFLEISKVSNKEKSIKEIPTEIMEWCEKFKQYINENRIQSAFSKEGPIERTSQLGDYIRIILNDAITDFSKDYPDIKKFDKNQKKIIFNVGKIISDYLYKFLDKK